MTFFISVSVVLFCFSPSTLFLFFFFTFIPSFIHLFLKFLVLLYLTLMYVKQLLHETSLGNIFPQNLCYFFWRQKTEQVTPTICRDQMKMANTCDKDLVKKEDAKPHNYWGNSRSVDGERRELLPVVSVISGAWSFNRKAMLAPFRWDEVKEGSMFQNSIVPQPASSKDVNKLKEKTSEAKTVWACVCVRVFVRSSSLLHTFRSDFYDPQFRFIYSSYGTVKKRHINRNIILYSTLSFHFFFSCHVHFSLSIHIYVYTLPVVAHQKLNSKDYL